MLQPSDALEEQLGRMVSSGLPLGITDVGSTPECIALTGATRSGREERSAIRLSSTSVRPGGKILQMGVVKSQINAKAIMKLMTPRKDLFYTLFEHYRKL